MMPSLFAVWRPCLGRWQLCEPVRGLDGTIRRLRTAYGPWIRATIHTTAGGGDTESVSIGGKPCQFRRINQHIALWLLDDRDVVMQRVPVLRVDGRRLPRGGC